MPILSNPRHEAFAQRLAGGMAINAAYCAAGYTGNTGNASRLHGKPEIIERVRQLKNVAQNIRNRSSLGVALTTGWVTEQLIGVVIEAKAQGKPDLAGANKALHLLGLELGMFVERKETGIPGQFQGLSMASKRDRLINIAKQLGLSHVTADGRRMVGNYLTVPDDDETGT